MATTSFPPDQTALPAPRPWHQRLTPLRHGENHSGPDAIDIGLAVVCFVVFTLPVLMGVTSGIGSLPAIAALGAAATAPLIVRRRWPVAVLFGVSATLCLAAVVGVRFTPWVSNAGPAVAVAGLRA